MKINKRSVSTPSYSPAGAAYGKAQQKSNEAAKQGGDSVEVSESAGLYQKAMDVAAAAPDIRTEAVSGIQKEFADGTYHRDETEVAEKVIQDYMEKQSS